MPFSTIVGYVAAPLLLSVYLSVRYHIFVVTLHYKLYIILSCIIKRAIILRKRRLTSITTTHVIIIYYNRIIARLWSAYRSMIMLLLRAAKPRRLHFPGQRRTNENALSFGPAARRLSSTAKCIV